MSKEMPPQPPRDVRRIGSQAEGGNSYADALVLGLGALRLNSPIQVATGSDTSTMAGKCRFDVKWKKSALPFLDKHPNAALLYQRYNPALFASFAAFESYPSADREKAKKVGDARKAWEQSVSLAWFAAHCSASPSSIDRKLLARLHTRRTQALDTARWRPVSVTTAGRSAVGLAATAPYENAGWAFHHTYGFPILPAASLKGVARHFLRDEWGWLLDSEGAPKKGGAGRRPIAEVPRLASLSLGPLKAPRSGRPALLPANPTADALAALLFGGPADAEGEGALTVLDGWPTDNGGWFEVDVLTPHHGEYYSSDSGKKPTDGDDPTPHSFLALRDGLRFNVWVGISSWLRPLDGACRRVLLDAGEAILRIALETSGIGAKTASGYGRMARSGSSS